MPWVTQSAVSGSLPWVTQSVFQVTGGASDAAAAAPNDANVEFLGRCLGVHRNAMEQEPFILATAIAAKCLGAHPAPAPQTPAQPSVLAFHTAFRRCW